MLGVGIVFTGGILGIAHKFSTLKKSYEHKIASAVEERAEVKLIRSDVDGLKEWRTGHIEQCSIEHKSIIERVEAESASIRDLIATNELASEGKRANVYAKLEDLSKQLAHLSGWLEATLDKKEGSV